MLRAAACSLRLRYPTTRTLALAATSRRLLQPSSPLSLHQQRNYIFLPASFQELQQVLREAWTSHKEKQKTILVKLWQRRPSTKSRRAAMLTRKWSSHVYKQVKQRHHRRYLTSKRRFLNAKRMLRDKIEWKYKSLTLTEPVQEDWFDANGYPQASRNAFGRFVNPWNSQSTNGMHSLWSFCKWRMERLYNTLMRGNYTSSNATHQQHPPLAFQTSPPPKNQIRVTWLGHATTLCEMGNTFTVLTDPMFSHRAAPWPFGVVRHSDPPCRITDLPSSIDVCVISHDHYDHLDEYSVEKLRQKVQYWAVPLGIGEWLQSHCDVPKRRILEMTWWQSSILKRTENGLLCVVQNDDSSSEDDDCLLTVTCAPAQHWCGRSMWDRNQRLWCSWVAAAGGQKLFFAGDTAFPETFPLHRQIGDRLGPFDVALLPIGAYSPQYFMKTSHAHPREAVQIHQDLRSSKSLGIHWGTFALAEEEHDEPPLLLKEAADKAGVDFTVVSPGECIVVGPGSEESRNKQDAEETALRNKQVVETSEASEEEPQDEYG